MSDEPIQSKTNIANISSVKQDSDLKVKVDDVSPVAEIKNMPWKGKFADIMEQHVEVRDRKMEDAKLEKHSSSKANDDQRSLPIKEAKPEDVVELSPSVKRKEQIDEKDQKVLKNDDLSVKASEKPVTNAGKIAKSLDQKLNFFQSLFATKKEILTKDNKSDIKEEEINFSKLTPNERQEILNIEKDFNQGMASVFDLIAPSSFEVNFDHLRIEGLYAQSYYIFSYPRFIEANWLSPVVNFDITFDISQFIYPTTSEKIMRVLKKKVAQMQSTIRMNAEKGKVHDPAIETSLQDAEQLRVELQRGQERYFQFALYITVYAEDSDKLKKIEKQLQSLLGGKLVITKRADFQMEQAFTSTCPLGLDQVEIFRNMNTSPLSTTFPFSSSDLTSNEGILYGINRHNDSLIIFDRFSLENANSVVFAKSGAGKSYAVKLEILRYLMMGVDVIVIDPENEYKALSDSVGGSYMRVSLNSDRRINPFDLPKALEGEEAKPGDLLRSVIMDLTGLMKLMLGSLTPLEASLLDKALIDVYATKGITMDTPDPSVFTPPTMEDLYAVLSSMEGAEQMAQRVQKYTTGTFAGLFNKPTNIALDNGLVVFSVRDLEDELRPVAMYVILGYIWNKVRSQMKKRLLVIDEAWSMMQHEDSARFLFGLVKRARKYYLGVTTITQDVEDFLKSSYGKPIITNSSMQLLLKQSPTAIEILKKIFNLTEGEKYMLLNSGVGQGLFFAGLKHVALQIIASYTEDRIITTNPEEILKGRTADQRNFAPVADSSSAATPVAAAPEAPVVEEKKDETVAPAVASTSTTPVSAEQKPAATTAAAPAVAPVQNNSDGFDNTAQLLQGK